MKRGLGLITVFVLALLSGCARTGNTGPGFDGIRVLLRYDFGIGEYASVDSAKQEMERWAEAYAETPDDHFTGTVAVAEMKETEDGYQGYLDCGDIENFEGVQVYSAGEGAAWEPGPMTVTDMATGEEVCLDESFLTALPASYAMVYGPAESLLMGADRIVLEMNGTVRYASIGWTGEKSQISADPAALYEQAEGIFAVVYEPENKGCREGKRRDGAWVGIFVVGIVGIAGILALSLCEMRGTKRMKGAGN